MALVGTWIVVLLGRLVELQLVRHDEFARRARRQQERTVELAPRRGAITDRAGRPLAVTTTVDSVFAIPTDVRDPEATARELSPLVGVPWRELEKRLSDDEREFVWVARRVEEGTAQAIRTRHLPGIRLLKESARRYPQGSLAASVLGYVGTDNQGLAGLEYKYETAVRGRPARVTVLRDAAQRSYKLVDRSGGTGGRTGDEVEGSSLVLTLDASIQHAAERELDAAVAAYHARGGSVVVLEPATGAVLALASAPGFDPNRYAEADADRRRCRPVADAYEPGSTFKLVTASAALDAGIIGPDDVIDCGGGSLTVGRTTIHEHGHNAWGSLPLSGVLAHSSNIGAAHIGLALGKASFFRAVRAFGFGQKTGIDLDGESGGLLADVSSWSALTLPTMSFGQEIGVTVLQMARAFAAVANGGILPTPYLVSEVHDPSGHVERRAPPPGPRVTTEETAREMRRLLTGVVDDGTGKAAAIEGYEVAGKTGTAQKANPGGGYSADRFVASFIGFVPAERPRVVIAVVVDEPKGKIYGGDVAAPVFSAVGAEVMRILGEAPRPEPERITPSILTADLGRGALPAAGLIGPDLVRTSSRVSPGGEPPIEEALRARLEPVVPDLAGQSAREAVRALARSGLTARLSGHGFVTAQDPPAGTPVARGASCRLVLALEPPAPAPAGDGEGLAP